MTQSRSNQEKPEAKQTRAAQRDRRTQQLELAKSNLAAMQQKMSATRKLAATRNELSSHVSSFYLEIDKLTKGKSLVEVTDLTVERVNDIVRDAKAVVENDAYLDRVKEFVAAGNNPVYPDVLMTTSIIQESLGRFKVRLEAQIKQISKLLLDARTIQHAFELYLDEEEIPTKEQIDEMLGIDASEMWFSWDENEETQYFDFDRFDTYDIGKYFSNINETSNA